MKICMKINIRQVKFQAQIRYQDSKLTTFIDVPYKLQ